MSLRDQQLSTKEQRRKLRLRLATITGLQVMQEEIEEDIRMFMDATDHDQPHQEDHVEQEQDLEPLALVPAKSKHKPSNAAARTQTEKARMTGALTLEGYPTLFIQRFHKPTIAGRLLEYSQQHNGVIAVKDFKRAYKKEFAMGKTTVSAGILMMRRAGIKIDHGPGFGTYKVMSDVKLPDLKTPEPVKAESTKPAVVKPSSQVTLLPMPDKIRPDSNQHYILSYGLQHNGVIDVHALKAAAAASKHHSGMTVGARLSVLLSTMKNAQGLLGYTGLNTYHVSDSFLKEYNEFVKGQNT